MCVRYFKFDNFWRRSLKMRFFMDKNTGIRRVSGAGIVNTYDTEKQNLWYLDNIFNYITAVVVYHFSTFVNLILVKKNNLLIIWKKKWK